MITLRETPSRFLISLNPTHIVSMKYFDSKTKFTEAACTALNHSQDRYTEIRVINGPVIHVSESMQSILLLIEEAQSRLNRQRK